METAYVYNDPLALAHQLEHRLHLSGSTAHLFETVMVGSSNHKFSAVLIAIVNLFFFGAGFGRVLQLVHARSWGIDLRKNALRGPVAVLRDRGRLIAVLTFLFVLQTPCPAGIARRGSATSWTSAGSSSLSGSSSGPPGSCSTGACRRATSCPAPCSRSWASSRCALISQILLHNWLGWYSKTYGALGIVMAIFFWLIILSTIMVLAAALSPALAHRRDILQARMEPARGM